MGSFSEIRHTLGDVDVFTLVLRNDGERKTEWLAYLSQAERARVDSFQVEAAGLHFIARRVALRQVLSRYLGVEPVDVRLVASAYGKLELAEQSGPHFNCSHSGQQLLIGIHKNTAVGVDIERVVSIPDMDLLVEQHFADSEVTYWKAATSAEASVERFYRVWTRKEAVAKALGFGLSLSFNCFAATGSGGAPRLSITQSVDCCQLGRVFEEHSIRIEDVEAPVGYMAALAVLAVG